jgi:hypothetical protein
MSFRLGNPVSPADALVTVIEGRMDIEWQHKLEKIYVKNKQAKSDRRHRS